MVLHVCPPCSCKDWSAPSRVASVRSPTLVEHIVATGPRRRCHTAHTLRTHLSTCLDNAMLDALLQQAGIARASPSTPPRTGGGCELRVRLQTRPVGRVGAE